MGVPIFLRKYAFYRKAQTEPHCKAHAGKRNIAFKYGDELIASIASRYTEVDSGARKVDHILTDTLLPDMSREILTRMAKSEQIKGVKVAIDGEGFRFDIQ